MSRKILGFETDEDYALIAGTMALLVALGTLMYFTRTLSRRQQGGPSTAASAAG